MNANESESGAAGTAGEPIELEISDLAHARGGDQRSPRATLDERRPPRRAVQLLMILGPLFVALVIVLGSFAAVRDRAALLVFGSTPVPTMTLEPGSNLFYILPGLPWASITLDGRRLTHLPMVGADPPLRLARGRHILRWQGEPFQAWQCTISVPIAGGDSCPYDRGYTGNAPTTTSLFWVLTLYPNLTMLPARPWSTLVAAAQAALDREQSSDIVRPGELYVGGPQRFPGLGGTAASEPLRATLSFTLEVRHSPAEPVAPTCGPNFPSGCTLARWNCMDLCTWPEAGTPAYWSVLAPVYGTWSYATLTGSPVATDQPDGRLGSFAPLRIAWDGAAWHVALAPASPSAAYTSVAYPPDPSQPSVGDLACATLRAGAQSGGYPLGGPPPTVGYTSLSWRFATAAPLAAGCLGVATPRATEPGTPAGSLPPAYVLQRFGVLLAVNPVAHQLWPYLPMADAYEQTLARQLAGS